MKNFQRAHPKLKIFLGVFFLLIITSFVYSANWQTSTQTEFGAGNYSEITRNSDHIELSATKVSGTYTSKIFDA